jgi:hypothetical protein
MQEGNLFIDVECGVLLLVPFDPLVAKARLDLSRPLEVRFGSCWLRGLIQPTCSTDRRVVESYDLQSMHDESFIGLRSGMMVRQ